MTRSQGTFFALYVIFGAFLAIAGYLQKQPQQPYEMYRIGNGNWIMNFSLPNNCPGPGKCYERWSYPDNPDDFFTKRLI